MTPLRERVAAAIWEASTPALIGRRKGMRWADLLEANDANPIGWAEHLERCYRQADAARPTPPSPSARGGRRKNMVPEWLLISGIVVVLGFGTATAIGIVHRHYQTLKTRRDATNAAIYECGKGRGP